ncbi:hypothetical protein GTY85_27035 [Streptomyces sp. SID8377]|nr:hypothetical protein [Streptomyces sp. SID8377]
MARPTRGASLELRATRDELRDVERELAPLLRELEKLQKKRDAQIVALGGHDKAKADRMAPAAGLTISDIVFLVPALAPAGSPAAPAEQPAPVQPAEQSPGAVAPALQPAEEGDALAAAAPAVAEDVPAASAPAPEPAPAEQGTFPAQAPGTDRELPSIPPGERGDAWAAVQPRVVSQRPKFTQNSWDTAFLDAKSGMLVHKSNSTRIDLGSRSAADLLAALSSVLPESVERVYITAGDPWHRDADRYPHLTDAVVAWLTAPTPGWSEASGGGQAKAKDKLAGHYVHERLPVGRWQQGGRHLEICPIGTWFDAEGADPAVVRDAFVQLWKALHEQWPDVVLLGNPARTGRDLWSRTIPTKTGARWADGYPVMSTEIRALLHATAGQGRTELITPPRVPEQLPRLVELDRTFAYAKHTWTGGVGAPQRVSAATFRSWSEKEQISALYKPSHWQIRVTVPEGWRHIGLVPAPVTGDAAWAYPNEPGRSFVTWAGGAEVNLALRNHLAPWRIEILDGLVWESGSPLRDWADKLKTAWQRLRAIASLHGDDHQRLACHLASRGVRAILLYGVGAFAQRPRTTTGTVSVHEPQKVPTGAEIIATDGETITWRRATYSSDPYAHPEWAAGVWSGARAALLSTKMREDNVSVGALHLPPGSIVAFRTDAIYTTAEVDWPYHEQPGDYLLKGHLPGPVAAPTNLTELMSLRDTGREYLVKAQAEGTR